MVGTRSFRALTTMIWHRCSLKPSLLRKPASTACSSSAVRPWIYIGVSLVSIYNTLMRCLSGVALVGRSSRKLPLFALKKSR